MPASEAVLFLLHGAAQDYIRCRQRCDNTCKFMADQRGAFSTDRKATVITERNEQEIRADHTGHNP